MSKLCEHLEEATTRPGNTDGCEECLKSGGQWVQLRKCLTCGHVGCCDSSPGMHANNHYHATKHPVMQSAEPGQAWKWCYVDELMA